MRSLVARFTYDNSCRPPDFPPPTESLRFNNHCIHSCPPEFLAFNDRLFFKKMTVLMTTYSDRSNDSPRLNYRSNDSPRFTDSSVNESMRSRFNNCPNDSPESSDCCTIESINGTYYSDATLPQNFKRQLIAKASLPKHTNRANHISIMPVTGNLCNFK
jgi:hypothetical protein